MPQSAKYCVPCSSVSLVDLQEFLEHSFFALRVVKLSLNMISGSRGLTGNDSRNARSGGMEYNQGGINEHMVQMQVGFEQAWGGMNKCRGWYEQMWGGMNECGWGGGGNEYGSTSSCCHHTHSTTPCPHCNTCPQPASPPPTWPQHPW